MAKGDKPSYADLVYNILQSSDQPMTVREILTAVGARRPVTTRNPSSTIRSALTDSHALVSVGEGRYAHLAHLLPGSLLRLPLTEEEPVGHPIIYTPELRTALWPTAHEAPKRRDTRPVQVGFPDGGEATLELCFLGPGTWGSPMPETLCHYLVANRATAGDSLLIRVVDVRHLEASFEAREKRDTMAVAVRNQEMANMAYEYVRARRGSVVLVWDIATYLLAQGFYLVNVAPDPLETILSGDPRFGTMGYGVWMTAEGAAERGESLLS